MQPLADAYLSKGYLDVVVKADPAFDEPTKTVNYNLTVAPGEVYTLHNFVFVGLDDPTQQATFRARFPMKTGEPYDPVALRKIMIGKADQKPGPLDPLAFKTTAYPVTHTVDLTLSFAGSTTINVR